VSDLPRKSFNPRHFRNFLKTRAKLRKLSEAFGNRDRSNGLGEGDKSVAGSRDRKDPSTQIGNILPVCNR
jgi:hypothetical protein